MKPPRLLETVAPLPSPPRWPQEFEGLAPGREGLGRRREFVVLHVLAAARRRRPVSFGEPVEHRLAREPRIVERRADRARVDFARERVEGGQRAQDGLVDDGVEKRRPGWLRRERGRGCDLVRRLRHGGEQRCRGRHRAGTWRPGGVDLLGEAQVDVVGIVAQDRRYESKAREPCDRAERSGHAAAGGDKRIFVRQRVDPVGGRDLNRAARDRGSTGRDELVVLAGRVDVDSEVRA